MSGPETNEDDLVLVVDGRSSGPETSDAYGGRESLIEPLMTFNASLLVHNKPKHYRHDDDNNNNQRHGNAAVQTGSKSKDRVCR